MNHLCVNRHLPFSTIVFNILFLKTIVVSIRVSRYVNGNIRLAETVMIVPYRSIGNFRDKPEG